MVKFPPRGPTEDSEQAQATNFLLNIFRAIWFFNQLHVLLWLLQKYKWNIHVMLGQKLTSLLRHSEDWGPPPRPVPGGSPSPTPTLYPAQKPKHGQGEQSSAGRASDWTQKEANISAHVSTCCCVHLRVKHKLFLDSLWVCIIDDGDFSFWLGWLRMNCVEPREQQGACQWLPL